MLIRAYARNPRLINFFWLRRGRAGSFAVMNLENHETPGTASGRNPVQNVDPADLVSVVRMILHYKNLVHVSAAPAELVSVERMILHCAPSGSRFGVKQLQSYSGPSAMGSFLAFHSLPPLGGVPPFDGS